MENAPLTLAYTHARNAAQETKRSNPVAASEEHDLASAEFAAAAATTSDVEALRVLKLLEQHHKQLALILKDMHSKPSSRDQYASTSTKSISAGDSTIQPPRLTQTSRVTARDLSSSIASNLASARGIPSTKQRRTIPVSPLVSNDHADGTFTQDLRDTQPETLPTLPHQPSTRPSWAPPEMVTPKSLATTSSTTSPFQHFYSRFENAISTLTAPLAFPSLPLTQQPPPKEEEQKRAPSPKAVKRSLSKADASLATLDISQLISNAAYRAVTDNNGYGYTRPNESFVHVPTSGGTASYADMASNNYIEQQARRAHRRDLSNASNDDFVDASSQFLQQGQAPSFQPSDRNSSAARATNQPKYQGKTMEELALANETLRKDFDSTLKRLHAFELAAQDARMAQSIRSLQLSPVTTPENSRGKMIAMAGGLGNDAGMRFAQKRIEELEEALRKNDRRINKRDEENAKLKETLGKYREKWDDLKAGAKKRRAEAAGDKQNKGSASTATTSTTAASPPKDKNKEREPGEEIKG